MLSESEQRAQAGRYSRPLPRALLCEASYPKLCDAGKPESLVIHLLSIALTKRLCTQALAPSPSFKVDDDL